MNPAATNDRSALLARARQGDEESLGELLQSYRNYLQLVARTQINQHLTIRVNPSDIVQETFLQACHAFGQFEGTTEAELLAWLRRILVSRLISTFRAHLSAKKRDVRRQRSLEQMTHDMDRSTQLVEAALIAQGSTPSLHVQRRELAALVADRVAELPAQYREVIILRSLEGRTFEDIAERTGGTADAARRLWVRAVGRLRLSADEEPEP
jgi:RNA polymerase sigma-70 factor (ECF subfamily)